VNRIQCFMVEHTKRSRYALRRYCRSEDSKCSGRMGFHNACSAPIADTDDDPSKDYLCSSPPARPEESDSRWPTKCEACDYVFTALDQFQVVGDPLYRRVDTGEILPLDEMPAGAMWFQPWYAHFYGPGPDGRHLVVRLPGGADWCVDGRANNCTRPGDTVHKCWVRDGEPPLVTAGKAGDTCSAGAGSIAVPGYHGFLRNGFLEEC
jgi:hypothetical protein